MPGRKITVIGIAPEGKSSLSSAALRTIARADILIGGRRLLDMFDSVSAEKVIISNNLSELEMLVKEQYLAKRIIFLASGDPGFYGIAGYLLKKFGKSQVRIVPNVSAMQHAFARIGETWDDAAFVSVHGRPVEDVLAVVKNNRKIGIFTDDQHNPAAIARLLLENRITGYRAHICENLGEKTERITETSLAWMARRKFSSLNTIILIKKPHKEPVMENRPILGIPDNHFVKRRPLGGLITKQEIRAVSLSKMCITDNAVIWDIGAGSGALSIEASRLAKSGCVYAVEKNEADVSIIHENIRKFGAMNITVIHSKAPEGLEALPAPDTIFIGGSGGRMKEIIRAAASAIKSGGRIVLNFVVLQNMQEAIEALSACGFQPDITLVSIAKGTGILDLTRLAALNPVFIVSASKKKGLS